MVSEIDAGARLSEIESRQIREASELVSLLGLAEDSGTLLRSNNILAKELNLIKSMTDDMADWPEGLAVSHRVAYLIGRVETR